jgi:hypothetical protein
MRGAAMQVNGRAEGGHLGENGGDRKADGQRIDGHTPNVSTMGQSTIVRLAYIGKRRCSGLNSRPGPDRALLYADQYAVVPRRETDQCMTDWRGSIIAWSAGVGDYGTGTGINLVRRTNSRTARTPRVAGRHHRDARRSSRRSDR